LLFREDMYRLALPGADRLPHQRVCPDTFLEVLMASLGSLRQLALKLTHSSADADDLLQATCLRAMETASRLRDHSNLAGWLSRVMRNLQIDQSRSRARRTVPLTDRQIVACAPEGIAMWRQIDDEEVARVLPRLSPQLRVVWEMHHVEGLDQNAIAARLAIPRTTVATRMFRARLALRRALLERFGASGEADGEQAGKALRAAAGRGRADGPRVRTRRRPPRPRLRVHAGGKAGQPAMAVAASTAPVSTQVDSATAPATRTVASAL
jgi:RNA polymerase sigma-70 factor (ECF subfamily)